MHHIEFVRISENPWLKFGNVQLFSNKITHG